MTSPIVQLVGISRTFDEERVVALRDVDLEVEAGEFIAVTGRSGSGKTTLLNILGLLDRPSSGAYRLAGESAADLAEKDRAALRGRQVGFVFQNSFLISTRTSLENVDLALQMAGFPRGPERTERAREMLASVGLSHRLDARPATLSGGERQRVALARALSTGPSLLLCDEPTGNLDGDTGEQVMRLIEAAPAAGSCVILVTHDLDLAARADWVVTLKDGLQVGQSRA